MTVVAVLIETRLKRNGIEVRSDGWPLCPTCGEDELADILNTYARADAAELFCYRCGRVTVRHCKPVRA